MKCPNCGGNNCQFVTSSEKHTSYFNFGDACCGYICLGPLGLLCGLCDAGSSTTTKEYWICHGCGTKFSAQEAKRNIARIEAERKKKAEFFFFVESPIFEIRSEQSELWKRFNEYYQDKVCGGILESCVVLKNPTIRDERLEQLKTEVAGIFGEAANIVFALTAGDGMCFTEESIVWKGHAAFLTHIQQINCCKNVVYINQSCLQMPTSEMAVEVFELLGAVLPEKRGKQYEEYPQLLQVLQDLQPESSERELHYSTRPEYANYIKETLEDCMKKYSQTHPAQYAEYERIRNEKVAKEKKWLKASGVAAVIGGVCGLLLGSVIGGIIGVAVFGVVPVVLIELTTVTNRWNEYKTIYLSNEIYVLLQENEKTNLKKTGQISPRYYEEYLSERRTVACEAYDSVCSRCGRKMEKGWNFCPFCQKQKRIKM